MDFHAVLGPACTRVLESVSSKKRLLEMASESIAAAHEGIDARGMFDHLMARERLGSTGLGDGVAIPHCRIEGRKEPVGALLKLDNGVDFDAPDDAPVSLIFVLAAPVDGHDVHLQVLAKLAAVFGNADSRAELLACTTDKALYSRIHSLLEAVA
ncbi:MAG: PTS transporter subunit EIIA [Gammaproteobacteria bacterium]|nr:PTS transporter subunit EIIA [Gammaproteobacteria bacterium]